jgi:hypothetical protein
VTYEDQIVALFAKANPVPSLALLDPVEPFDVSHLANRSERSSAMTDIKTEELKTEPGRRPRLALALAVGLIGLIALGILVTRDSPVASPASVANAYMEALANLDAEAALALFAPDGTAAYPGGNDLSQTSALFDWYRATGWETTPGECTEISTGEGGTLVECPNEFEDAWGRALSHAPIGGEVQVLVSDSEIATLVLVLDEEYGGIWETFRIWIDENHPDDFDLMYAPNGPLLDDESIALWEQYTAEFVASLQ